MANFFKIQLLGDTKRLINVSEISTIKEHSINDHFCIIETSTRELNTCYTLEMFSEAINANTNVFDMIEKWGDGRG